MPRKSSTTTRGLTDTELNVWVDIYRTAIAAHLRANKDSGVSAELARIQAAQAIADLRRANEDL